MHVRMRLNVTADLAVEAVVRQQRSHARLSPFELKASDYFASHLHVPAR